MSGNEHSTAKGKTMTHAGKKHRKDGNHGRRGLVSGNGRYSRARVSKLLDGKRSGDGRKNATMGSN